MVVVSHQTGVVPESALNQQVHGVRGQVPRRGAVAGRASAAGQPPYAVAAAIEDGGLLIARQRGRRLVQVPVVTHLVATAVDAVADLRICVDRVAWDKPGRAKRASFEKPQKAVRAYDAELTSRQRRWSRLAAVDPG